MHDWFAATIPTYRHLRKRPCGISELGHWF